MNRQSSGGFFCPRTVEIERSVVVSHTIITGPDSTVQCYRLNTSINASERVRLFIISERTLNNIGHNKKVQATSSIGLQEHTVAGQVGSLVDVKLTRNNEIPTFLALFSLPLYYRPTPR
jgi:hypothetical protein